MEPLELQKAVGSVFRSLDGLSWPGGAHSGADLDPDLLKWCCPMDTSTDASAPRTEEQHNVNFLDSLSIDHLLTTFHGTGRNRSDLTEDAFLSSLLEPSLLAPEADSAQSCLFPHMDVCPPNSTDASKSMQSPFQAPADSAQDSLWGLAWEALESRMGGAEDGPQPMYDLSPACSMDLSGHVSTGWEGTTTFNQACSAQREGSTGSEESCSYLPATFGFAAADFLPEPAAWAPRADASPAAAKPAADNAFPASAEPPAAAAQLQPATAAQMRTAELAGKPSQAAARPKTAPAAAVRPPPIPARPAAARAGPAKRRRLRPGFDPLKSRQMQRDYMQRRREREAAVHAAVEEQLQRKAALERDVGALLQRHEHLTSQRPWHEQHEAVKFTAAVASLLPAPAGGRSKAPAAESMPDMLQKFMLEPAAMIDQMYLSAGLKPQKEAAQASPASKEAPPMQLPALSDESAAASGAISWRSIVACLGLTEDQRNEIAALYSTHMERNADLHQDCLDIATKLQLLPGVEGNLTDGMWPSLATHVISSQLSSITRSCQELTAALTTACCQVLSEYQRNYLKALAPSGPLDLRQMCREIVATGKACTARKAALKKSPAHTASQILQEPAAGVEAPPASLAANRAALLHDCNMAPYLSSPPVMQDKMQAVAQLNDTGHVSKCAQLDSGAGAAGWELPADLHKRWLLEFPWEVEDGPISNAPISAPSNILLNKRATNQAPLSIPLGINAHARSTERSYFGGAQIAAMPPPSKAARKLQGPVSPEPKPQLFLFPAGSAQSPSHPQEQASSFQQMWVPAGFAGRPVDSNSNSNSNLAARKGPAWTPSFLENWGFADLSR